MSRHGIDRRNFLRGCVAGAVVLGTQRFGWAAGAPKSRVVIASDAALRGSSATPDSARVLKLLDRAVQAFYGVDNPIEAWKKIAKPGETVGLKVNCLAGRGFTTHTVLTDAICERLRGVGIRNQNIVIFDRSGSDLEAGSFRQSARGVRCIGNDSAGYEDELSVYGSVGSLLSRTLTRTCDAVINLPILKDHGITGMTGALKAMYGVIHNPNKYHTNFGDPYIADLNMLPEIRNKVRLTIMDAITAEYNGGPSHMPQWQWPMNALLVARDPVAMDTTAWQIIEAKRKEKGLKSLKAAGREPIHIATAADAQHRLGTNDPARIERVEI